MLGKIPLKAGQPGRRQSGLARLIWTAPKNYATLYYAYIVAILNEPITTRAKSKSYSL